MDLPASSDFKLKCIQATFKKEGKPLPTGHGNLCIRGHSKGLIPEQGPLSPLKLEEQSGINCYGQLVALAVICTCSCKSLALKTNHFA